MAKLARVDMLFRVQSLLNRVSFNRAIINYYSKKVSRFEHGLW